MAFRLNYEKILELFRQRLIDGNIPKLTAETIILPGNPVEPSMPFSVELSLGTGDSSSMCETLTNHPAWANIIVGIPSGSDAGRQMANDVCSKIGALFDPLDSQKRVLRDVYGNKICIDTVNQKPPDTQGTRLRVNVQLGVRIWCKH